MRRDYHARGWRTSNCNRQTMTDSEQDTDDWQEKLEELRVEHRDLDDVIARVAEEAPFDQIRIQRLKKRKLLLRDEIARIENILLPDIIA